MFKVPLLVTASVTSFLFGLFGVEWDAVDEKIDREFPAISFISSQELHHLYNSDDELPLIIDVREPEEFAVSHLPGAINIQTGAEVARQYSDREEEIIVYCSVGYRSAGVAADLQALGYTRVRNLRHAIFEWANSGYPLLNQFGETALVHPYNRIWGILLDKHLHRYSLPE